MAPNVSISWLYDLAATKWSKWLPKEALETVKKAGHYAVNVSPKLKLISLNSNFCQRMNFYIMMNPVDPGGQLQFLINELDKAERDGQYVMIISHIPAGGSCLNSWIHNYFRIVERYQHLLVAQYQGHTHKDQFVVIYSNHSNSQSSLGQRTIKPVGVQLIGPSLTTYDYLNPGYRVFTLDGNVSSRLEFMIE
jgi:sphingomyelin phosphodiesterase